MRKTPGFHTFSRFIQIDQGSIPFISALLGLLLFGWTWDEGLHEHREVGDGSSRMLAVEPAPSMVETLAFGLPFMYGAKIKDNLDGGLRVFFLAPLQESHNRRHRWLGETIERVEGGKESRCIGSRRVLGELAVRSVVECGHECRPLWRFARFPLLF
jgi:hypothetical protein